MQRRTLGRTGIEVSSIGFGAAPLGQEYGELDEAGGARLVARALELGVTLFDVAPYYGRTLAEERLGRALEGRRQIETKGTKRAIGTPVCEAAMICSCISVSIRIRSG